MDQTTPSMLSVRIIFRTIACAGLMVLLPSGTVKQWQWPGRHEAAIVLTYDDALLSQLNIAIPQLDSFKFKGTFFLSGNMREGELDRWRAASREGHELANHTLFHPCAFPTLKGQPRYVTENYTASDMLREIEMMNKWIFAIAGKKVDSYAYPCAETLVGGRDYTDSLRKSGLVQYARVGGNADAIVTDFAHLDKLRVPSWGFGDSPDGARLIQFAKKVLESKGMGVLMFHGVGGDYLNVSAEAHRELLEYLAANRSKIWVASFGDVMNYVGTHANE